MRAEQLKFVPPVPRTLKALGDVLKEYLPVTEYYRGCARGTVGLIGLVFIHENKTKETSLRTGVYSTFSKDEYRGVGANMVNYEHDWSRGSDC
ncbi:hypothetical protein TSAR_009122 [Trichomalopsis sarcophagae]|uniref:Uncharacterized protein n=1 Tax=Trichomalopsis sarcophagae TaxID=543379 RepID=A0A232EKQ7_9HYME|nr:hypothetical protein TSAR_009122 [Trichomalopsis sarcophagae]